MPSKVPDGLDDCWTDSVPQCPLTGVGRCINARYRLSGPDCQMYPCEDQFFRLRSDDGWSVYGVLDGRDGLGAVEYAAQKLPAELLLGQLSGDMDDEHVKNTLKLAFQAVETSYMSSIDGDVAARDQLLMQLPSDNSNAVYQVSAQNQNSSIALAQRLEDINYKIGSGCSVAAAVLKDNRLFVAHVGDCRVLLLCRQKSSVKVCQLTADHFVDNEDEKNRLKTIGLDIAMLRHYTHPTRLIGDHPRKGGYKDIELLNGASSDPVIAEPDILGPMPLDDSYLFLILLTGGVVRCLEDITGAEKVNSVLATYLVQELLEQQALNTAAQATVDRIARVHHDAFSKPGGFLCHQRQDMTLLVRQLQPLLEPCQSGEHTHENVSTCNTDFVSTNPTVSSLISHKIVGRLELDSNGRVVPYTDFSAYFEAEAAGDERLKDLERLLVQF